MTKIITTIIRFTLTIFLIVVITIKSHWSIGLGFFLVFLSVELLTYEVFRKK